MQTTYLEPEITHTLQTSFMASAYKMRESITRKLTRVIQTKGFKRNHPKTLLPVYNELQYIPDILELIQRTVRNEATISFVSLQLFSPYSLLPCSCSTFSPEPFRVVSSASSSVCSLPLPAAAHQQSDDKKSSCCWLL